MTRRLHIEIYASKLTHIGETRLSSNREGQYRGKHTEMYVPVETERQTPFGVKLQSDPSSN